MNDASIYGYEVEEENFTNREAETKRLHANFEQGFVENQHGTKSNISRLKKALIDRDIMEQ